VRLRLHGTPAENRAVLAALATALDIHSIGKPFSDRPPSALERIYVDAIPRVESREAR
jgi:hypothetical protein